MSSNCAATAIEPNDPTLHRIQSILDEYQCKLEELDLLIDPDHHRKYLREHFDSILKNIKLHRYNLLHQLDSETDRVSESRDSKAVLDECSIKLMTDLRHKQCELLSKLDELDQNKVDLCAKKIDKYKKNLYKFRMHLLDRTASNEQLEHDLTYSVNKLNHLIIYLQHKLRLYYNVDFIPLWNLGLGRLEFRKTSLELVENGYYEGDIENGLMHGVGKLVYFNGNKYEGEFADHKICGNGTIWKNGFVLNGSWYLDLNKGHGVLWTRNNDICHRVWESENLETFFDLI